jgi:hypothetical protein
MLAMPIAPSPLQVIEPEKREVAAAPIVVADTELAVARECAQVARAALANRATADHATLTKITSGLRQISPKADPGA